MCYVVDKINAVFKQSSKDRYKIHKIISRKTKAGKTRLHTYYNTKYNETLNRVAYNLGDFLYYRFLDGFTTLSLEEETRLFNEFKEYNADKWPTMAITKTLKIWQDLQ